MFNILKTLRPNLEIIYPLDVSVVQQASHQGGTRSVSTLQSNLTFCGFPLPQPDRLILIDDVVTSGSHYRACVDFLRLSGYTGMIYGLFWARTIVPAATTSVVQDFDPI